MKPSDRDHQRHHQQPDAERGSLPTAPVHNLQRHPRSQPHLDDPLLNGHHSTASPDHLVIPDPMNR